jgi:hypothetical protein
VEDLKDVATVVEGGVMEEEDEAVVFTKFMAVMGGDGLLRCGENSTLLIGLALLSPGLQIRISGFELVLYKLPWMLWQLPTLPLLPLLSVRGGGATSGSRSW